MARATRSALHACCHVGDSEPKGLRTGDIHPETRGFGECSGAATGGRNVWILAATDVTHRPQASIRAGGGVEPVRAGIDQWHPPRRRGIGQYFTPTVARFQLRHTGMRGHRTVRPDRATTTARPTKQVLDASRVRRPPISCDAKKRALDCQRSPAAVVLEPVRRRFATLRHHRLEVGNQNAPVNIRCAVYEAVVSRGSAEQHGRRDGIRPYPRLRRQRHRDRVRTTWPAGRYQFARRATRKGSYAMVYAR